jgi:hypothetical protein
VELMKSFYQNGKARTIREPYDGLKKVGFLRLLTLRKRRDVQTIDNYFRFLLPLPVDKNEKPYPHIWGFTGIYKEK